MQRTTVNGVELEYEVRGGSSEPVLLIGTGPLADSFLPLTRSGALAEGHRLVRYRQRDQSREGPPARPTTFAEHAADALALLQSLDIRRVHVVGHSTGATIALQLVKDAPDVVQSLVLLEPPLMGVPSAPDFFAEIVPALEAAQSGDVHRAMRDFLTVVTSLDWDTCRATLERHAPDGVDRAMRGAPAFFGSYLPALQEWTFGEDEARTIERPVLAVTGSRTHRLFSEGIDLLRDWIPHAEVCRVDGVAHLLHLERQEAVIRCLADFLARHPMEAHPREGAAARAG